MASSDAAGVDFAMVINTSSFKGTTIVDACSNSECVVMVTSDWRVFTCDLIDITKQQKYVELNFPTDDQAIDIVGVRCGRYHFLALSANGRVYSWGRNNYGQLGTPKKKRKHEVQNHEKQSPTPRLIPGLLNCDVIQIACGDDHSLAISRDGRLFSWGSNGHGQLGVGEGRGVRHHNATPTEVETLKGVPVKHIAAGSAHTIIGSKSGTFYVCGRNSHGQLGLQRTEDVKLPVKLTSVPGKVKEISCGDNHTSFLCEDGEIRVYGLGAGTHPCGWSKSELSPGRGDKSFSYSSLQSRGRYTFVVDEASGTPLALNHDEVREHGPLKDLQLDPLEESTFIDLFGPNPPPEWPSGCDNIDVKLWKVKKSSDLEDCVDLPGEVEETVYSRTGVDGNQGNQGSSRRIFILLNEGRMGTQQVAQQGKIHTLSSELLQTLSDVDDDITIEINRSASFQDAKIVFSSPACLNASFSQTGLNNVNGLNIDLKAVRQGFELISKKKKLLQWISKVVCMDLCRSIQLAPSFDDDDLRFYVILLECPIFNYPQHEWCRRVLAAVGRLMVYKGEDGGDVNPLSRLARWWKCESVSFRKAIVAYREAVAVVLRNKTIHSLEEDDFKTYLQVLTCLNQINIQHDITCIATFYIPDLRSSGDEKTELLELFLFHRAQKVKFSLLSFPFLIDLKTKEALLNFHYTLEEERMMRIKRGAFPQDSPRLHNLYLRFLPTPPVRLDLVVNRDDIFSSSVQEQLMEMFLGYSFDLHKPLRVVFEGESGIDEGPLSMEFFRLVFDELMDPEKNGLFRYINEHDPAQSRIWFRQQESGNTRTARMCGLLFGLSLYNDALVSLPTLPHLLYAKLLMKGPKSDMEEIEHLDKDFADQMSKLLNGSEDYVYGEEIELDNGEKAEITKENVHLYVEKKVQRFLAPSQFSEFQNGFHKVYDVVILNMFRPIELEVLFTGEKYFDWIALEKSTRYIGPYGASHPTITMFWEVFHAFDEGMKTKFLVFVTGSDRAPVGGLQNLGLTIDELPVPSDESDDDEGAYEDRLSRLCPVANHCDNNQYNRTVQLPMYTSTEVIEDRLMAALSFYNCPFHIA